MFAKSSATDGPVQVTNTIIRFIWIIYLPKSGPITPIRSFVVALLEVLRRCQWNACTSASFVYSTHPPVLLTIVWVGSPLGERTYR